jgi:hypothetical protein
MSIKQATAPPAEKSPLAVAMAGVVMVSYPGSPEGGRLKKAYQPGCPMVLPMMEAPYPYV